MHIMACSITGSDDDRLGIGLVLLYCCLVTRLLSVGLQSDMTEKRG